MSITVAGANQSGEFIRVTGCTGPWWPPQVRFAGCYEVSPQSGRALGVLKTFEVLGTVDDCLFISPAIILTGQYRNCSGPPADGEVIRCG